MDNIKPVGEDSEGVNWGINNIMNYLTNYYKNLSATITRTSEPSSKIG
jgi:hypothetical protein